MTIDLETLEVVKPATQAEAAPEAEAPPSEFPGLIFAEDGSLVVKAPPYTDVQVLDEGIRGAEPAVSNQPKKELSENKAASESSVSLSVTPDDPTILTAVIDRTATRSRIVEDLQAELAKFGVPYRDVDRRIFEAVRQREREGLSYTEASVRIFGNPDKAELIRYWHNNWKRQ